MFIDAIESIGCIDTGVFDFSAIQLKDNYNDPTKYGITFWGKKGEIFEVTGIYWHL